MKKRIFTFLFSVLAGSCLLFANGTLVGKLYYLLDASTHTATVTFQDNGWDNNYPDLTEANIPPTITYDDVPYNVTKIGRFAFYSCENITSVVIPDGITHIEDDAFHWSGITSLTIPRSVTYIAHSAFAECEISSVIWNAETCDDFVGGSPWKYSSLSGVFISPITTVIFGEGVQRIPAYILSGITPLTSVTIPNTITSIGHFAFKECANLTSINLPSGIMSIGEGAFYGCSQISSVIIPENVTTIEARTFAECTNLQTVSIPSGVSTIKGSGGLLDAGAFCGCTNLASIYNYRETPANAYSAVFDGVNKSTCKLYVPRNSIELYKNAPVWRDFYLTEAIDDVQAIEEIELENVQQKKIMIDGNVYILHEGKVYNMQGQEVR